jgi:hypothetical protein
MVTKIGNEIVVNSASDADPQRAPEVTALSGGGFVETWIDVVNPSTYDIRAQIFDAAGNKLGAEIDLGVNTGDVVRGVTGLANNAFAISWGDGAGVEIQLFNSAGLPSGGQIAMGAGGEPDLTTLTDGDFAVIFEYNNVANQGMAQGEVFSASGTPDPVGVFTAGSTPTSGDVVFRQQIAGLTTGGLVAVWEDAGQPGIFAQRLDAHGNLVGSQITVTTLSQERAVVAPLANGAFVVVWDQVFGVEARLFDANGNPVGSQFQVNTNTATNHVDHPGVATLGNGEFVVVWRNGGSSGNDSVEGQIFNADGTKSGGEFTVTTNMSRTEDGSLSVAALGHDEFIVTWDTPGSTDGVSNTIHAQIFEATGGNLPTVHFTALQPVNMKNLPGLHSLLTKHFSISHESKSEIKGNIGSFSYDFKSLPGHAFTFHHKIATGGTVGSFSVSANGAVAYKFTGLAVPVTTLDGFIDSHKSIASLTSFLLSENNIVTGSRGNDVLIGGPNHNIFIFKKPFGHDRIADFSANDVVEISHKIFHSFAQVEKHAHIVHGDVQIKVDAANTITLDTVHHVTDLMPGEFLFV